MQFSGFCPTDIRILSKSDCSAILRERSSTEDTVVIASRGTISRLNLETICSPNCKFLSSFSSNPTIDDLLECVRSVGSTPRRLICVGGGSAIDLGKSLCAVIGHDWADEYQSLVDAITGKAYHTDKRSIELIAVPTTAGTGADVTSWATVWDMRNQKKLSIDRPDLVPDMSLIVPEFMCSMSAELTLSTGLDALAQAMESFWSNARNPLSQALALEAVRYIKKYLPPVLDNLTNVEYRKGMCIGALLSGLAFSKTRTTACHSISYPLTMRYGTAHGFAVAVTLSRVAKLNSAAVSEINEIYDIFGGPHKFGEWLHDVSNPIQPLRLSAMGIPETDIPLLASEAFTQGRMDNNPIPFTQDDVEKILLSVL